MRKNQEEVQEKSTLKTKEINIYFNALCKSYNLS